MASDNEFTRPLKAKAQSEQASAKKPVLIALGLFLVFSLPLIHFYGGFSYVASLFAPAAPESQIVVVEKQVEPEPATAVPDESNIQEPQETVQETDSRIERDGNIIRIKPQPPQPEKREIKRQEAALAHLPDPQLVERGATGVIPKRSKEGLRAMDVYSRPPDTDGNFGVARVVLVIGGMGISQTSTQDAIQKLPPSVTLAFAPYGNSLTRWMQEARKAGHELLLQVPMEPLGYPQNNPGRHTLLTDVDLQENLANLHWAMSRITNYVGIMNYLGNRILAEPAALAPVFGEIAERGLMFFDDGTVKNSVAEGVALKELVPFARGEILIDTVRSRSAIAAKLDELSKQAKRTGLAVGVGNAFPDTIQMVADYARRAKEAGIEITPVTAIVRDPNT